MRRLQRSALGEEARALLCRRTLQIASAADGETSAGARARARRRKAQKLWDQEDTKVFGEVRAALRAMAPGPELCGYCEHGVGRTVDHFWPKEKYPLRAFTWENFLPACFDCNTFKGAKFPRDARGAPLLVDPAVEDPREHLAFAPGTGQFAALTPKGTETIRALGFDRRPGLDQLRADAWAAIRVLLVRYAQQQDRGRSEDAEVARGLICRHPFASALLALLDLVDLPRGPEIVGAEVVAALGEHPEIRSWL
jgi:hypothetical protein